MGRNQGRNGRCGAFALLLVLLLALPAWAGKPEVSYEVVIAESRPYVAVVSCESSGFSGDELSLSLAPRYGWIQDFWTNLYELSVTQDGRSLPVVKENVNTWEVRDLKPGRVLIRYSVGVPPRRWPRGGNVHERSVLTRYDGFFTGHALFLTPNLPALTAHVRISVPKGWEIASSWGEGTGPWLVRSRRELVSSYVTMGACRVYHTKGEGVSYTLAIGGAWKFQDRDLLELVRKIGDHYTKTLGEAPDERVFVVCRPGPTGSLAGSALDRSFYILLDPEMDLTLSSLPSSDVPSLLAHEMFHTWTRKLTPRVGDDTLAWFHEGFTNFAAARALLDTKLMSRKAYYSMMAGYWLKVRENPIIENDSGYRRRRECRETGGKPLAEPWPKVRGPFTERN
ncbi:MAG: hypothetical protein HYU64_14910 [Armatimonadetes bacterium]|nr:hypothetical protein [Armatimonadota bacterium]